MKSILRNKLLYFFLLICSLSYAQIDDAEEMLEYMMFMDFPTVTTSTQNETDFLKTPSSIIVITEKEIKSSGAKNLMDLLDEVPGISISKHAFGQNILCIRGITGTVNNDKIKLLKNGHPISEPVWGQWSTIYNYGLENIKQVEIIKGPGSALYGTGAFAGVINIITKNATDQSGVVIDTSFGSFDTVQSNIYYGINQGRNNYTFNYNYIKTDGEDWLTEQDSLVRTPLQFFTMTPDERGEAVESHVFDFDFNIGNFKFNSSYINREHSIPLSFLFTISEKGAQHKYDTWFVEGLYNWEISDKITITPKIAYDSFEYKNNMQLYPSRIYIPDINGDNIPEYWPNGNRVNIGYDAKNIKSEIKIDYQISDNNNLAIGCFYENIKLDNIKLEGDVHPLYAYNLIQMTDMSTTFPWILEADRNIKGFFFQDQIQFNSDWYAIIGGRYDDYNDFGSTFNPRTALVWDFNKKGGVLKIMYSTAFKAPVFQDMYTVNTISVEGNPNLDAEKLESFEVSLNYVWFNHLYFNISGYYQETEDLIQIVGVESFSGKTPYYENQGETDGWGSELTLKYVFSNKSNIYFNYNYSDIKDKQTNKPVSFTSDKSANAGINLLFKENINLNLDWDYTAEYNYLANEISFATEETNIFDIALTINDIQGWDFLLAAYNITDEDKQSAFYYYRNTPGVNYRVQVSKKF